MIRDELIVTLPPLHFSQILTHFYTEWVANFGKWVTFVCIFSGKWCPCRCYCPYHGIYIFVCCVLWCRGFFVSLKEIHIICILYSLQQQLNAISQEKIEQQKAEIQRWMEQLNGPTPKPDQGGTTTPVTTVSESSASGVKAASKVWRAWAFLKKPVYIVYRSLILCRVNSLILHMF